MISPVLLIVEDNPTQQFVIKQLCEKFDYSAHVVDSGEDALEALACANYSAVLMDVKLPGIDGIECARRIRDSEQKRGRHTPIIAVTGGTSDADRKRCLAAGIDDFIGKPFDVEAFRVLLLRWAYEPSRPNLKLLKPYSRGSQDRQVG